MSFRLLGLIVVFLALVSLVGLGFVLFYPSLARLGWNMIYLAIIFAVVSIASSVRPIAETFYLFRSFLAKDPPKKYQTRIIWAAGVSLTDKEWIERYLKHIGYRWTQVDGGLNVTQDDGPVVLSEELIRYITSLAGVHSVTEIPVS